MGQSAIIWCGLNEDAMTEFTLAWPMEKALDDLRAKFKAMPLNDPRRGPMSLRIVRLEDEIERRKDTAASIQNTKERFGGALKRLSDA